jgi:hypothetical protein
LRAKLFGRRGALKESDAEAPIAAANVQAFRVQSSRLPDALAIAALLREQRQCVRVIGVQMVEDFVFGRQKRARIVNSGEKRRGAKVGGARKAAIKMCCSDFQLPEREIREIRVKLRLRVAPQEAVACDLLPGSRRDGLKRQSWWG